MPQDSPANPIGPHGLRPGERAVFVYGTLRAGGVNDIRRLSPSPRWVGRGRLRGQLFDLGAYPGLLRGAGGWVEGEVYAVSPALEALLDEIEEVWPQRTGEYLRQEALVDLLDGQASGHPQPPVRCLLYAIHPSRVFGKQPLAVGIWPPLKA